MASFKILVLGDVVGRPGRKALVERLPKIKKKYKPDLIILQAENLTHGFGFNDKALNEMMDLGVDFFTGGNHIFKNEKNLEKNFSKFPIIRPANLIEDKPGTGFKLIEIGAYKILIINLLGRVFSEEKRDDPFKILDKILKEEPEATIKILDFHAEATSEKKSLGYYADGRLSLIYGTHTHVQTADETVLPKGTGYITDVGMVGIKHSSLGMDLENIINNFINGTTDPKIIPDHGLCIINGIFAKIDIDSGKALSVERIQDEVEI